MGRRAGGNPGNRFERIEVEPDPGVLDLDEPRPRTIYLKEHARSIITKNDSPNIGFGAGISPYRGCSHGVWPAIHRS